MISQIIDMHVARRHHPPCGCNTDLRFLEILPLKTHGMKHGPTGGPFRPIDDDRRMLAVQILATLGRLTFG